MVLFRFRPPARPVLPRRFGTTIRWSLLLAVLVSLAWGPAGAQTDREAEDFAAEDFAAEVLHARGSNLPTTGLDEEFHYRWSLGGLGGLIGRLFLPGSGEGVLSYRSRNGRLHSELLVTSKSSEKGEFWQYGSSIDPRTGDSLEAWSAYKWRDKEKSRRQEVEASGVKDIVAGILALRHDPPEKPRAMEIWSDGKVYPVTVTPKGREEREVGDRKVLTRHFSFEPRNVEGQHRWKGSMELWITDDQAATPVEIRIERSLANLHLRLVEHPETPP